MCFLVNNFLSSYPLFYFSKFGITFYCQQTRLEATFDHRKQSHYTYTIHVGHPLCGSQSRPLMLIRSDALHKPRDSTPTLSIPSNSPYSQSPTHSRFEEGSPNPLYLITVPDSPSICTRFKDRYYHAGTSEVFQ